MKLKALRLRDVRRFVEPVAIESFSGGLDVLAGPNEAGKSTLLAALDALFLEKHTAGGTKIGALSPYGGGQPLIEADFEASGQLWRLTKQFGRGKKAELTDLGAGRMVARGGEAEQMLAELIGTGEGGRGGPGLLWAGQKTLLTPQAVETSKKKEGGDAATLYRAIEREIEAAAGGSEARAVRQLVVEALSKLVPPARRTSPKAGSPYEAAVKERERVKEALAEARAAAEASAERLKAIAEQRQRRGAAPAAIAGLKEQLAAATATLSLKREAGQRLTTARAEERARHAEAAAAERELKVLDEALQELSELEPKVAADADRVASASAELSRLRTEVEKLTAAETEASADVQRLGDLNMRRGRADERARAAAEIEGKSRVLAAARGLEAEIAAARQQLGAIAIDGAIIGRLEGITRELAIAEARLTAAAPTVRIALAEGGAGKLAIGGAPVIESVELKVAEPLAIDIAGIGRVVIEPGASPDRAADEARVAAQRGEIGQLLRACGAESVAAARVRQAEAETQRRAIAEAEARLGGMAPKGVAELAREISGLEQGLAAEPADSDVPARSEIETRLAEARQRHQSAREGLDRARVAMAGATEAHARMQVEVARRRERLGELDGSLPPAAVRGEERARRASLRDAARQALGEAMQAASALAGTAPGEGEVDRLSAEREELERKLVKSTAFLAELEQSIAKLEGAQEQADEDGIGARVAALEGELERAERHVRRFETEVAELDVLLAALTAAESQSREHSFRPVTERLGAYLDLVLPGARAVLGEGLSPATIERSGLAEALGNLSDGTQEQLAVLARLAYARLIADTGEPVPLILDDALVYADDERIARMFAVLEEAAHHHQVLVLTCRERTFERLGGNRLSLTQWRPE